MKSTRRRKLRSRTITGGITACIAGALFGTGALSSPAPDSSPKLQARSALFQDIARESGIDFVHFNGMSGDFYYPEPVGAGVAVFDYDNDGDLDVFLPQGNFLFPTQSLAKALFRPTDPLPLSSKLYRNDTKPGAGNKRALHFTDATAQSGIKFQGYGMGVITGDIDNDGWVDLFVTAYGKTKLYRNRGNGTFVDVTEAAGLEIDGWTVSAAFIDYDRDGWLDLVAGSYVDFSLQNQKQCFTENTARDYCGPLAYEPVPNRLYRNLGNGRFEDVTASSGLARGYHGALGVVSADFNDDGWPDIFVANDGRQNELWMNQKNGTFRDEALLAGCALGDGGNAKAGMGVDAGDFDNDGDEDLILTQLKGEKASLYVNNGKGWFEDRASLAGIGARSLPYTGFGTVFFDYDNDGWLDIFMANGEVKSIRELAEAGDRYPLGQKKLLFHALGNGKFEDVTDRAGDVFSRIEVSRGTAVGDLDNDGAPDLIVTNNSGPVRVLHNVVRSTGNWIGLRMVGTKASRDMLGTKVEIVPTPGPVQRRRCRTDGSYASANDPRVLVGLGKSSVKAVRAHWPSGRVEEWLSTPINTYTTLREGTGTKVD